MPVKTWSQTGTTTLNISGICGVTSGEEYVLEVEATVEGKNGTDDIFKETNAVCP